MEVSTEHASLTAYEARVISRDFPATPSGALERSLWQQVKVIDDEESCWPWTGPQYKERNGQKTYGRFAVPASLMPSGRRLLTTAPRTVFWFACGYWPRIARHQCDNPPCCRPRHLLDGTQADNNHDRMVRGRSRNKPFPRGEQNPVAGLTEDMVAASRILYRAGFSFLRIAKILGRTESSIRPAAYGETWSHVTDPPPVGMDERKSPGGKLSRDQIALIRDLRSQGQRPRDLAAQFGVEPSNISYLTRDMRSTRPSSKRPQPFTDDEIREIRALVSSGVRQKDLLERYQITSATMSKIIRRQIYAHVA